MADFTDQDINGLLPGEPWTSAKTIAAFENPIAIAQGAPGAPRLYGLAAVPDGNRTELSVLSLSASDAVTLGSLHFTGGFFGVTEGGLTFVTCGTITSVLMTGTVRFVATQTSITPSEGNPITTEARFLKNGVVIQTFSLSSGITQASAVRTIDSTVAIGDTFEWQVRRSSAAGGSASLSAGLIKANDGYTRIGIPIKASDM